MQRLWTKNFILIFIINTLLTGSFTLINAIITLYITDIGLAVSIAGTLSGVLAISAMVIRPFSGLAIDSFSNKCTLLLGIGLFTLMTFLHICSENSGFLMIVRILNGAGWGLASTATISMAGKTIPEERMSEGIGIYGLGQIISMAVAPMLALWLLGDHGYRFIFILSVFLAAGAIILSLFFDESLMVQHGTRRKGIRSFSGFISSLAAAGAVVPGLTYMFTTLVFASLVGFLPLFGQELGIRNIGVFFTVYACTLFITRLLSGRLQNRIHERTIIITGFVMLLISCVFLSRISAVESFIIAAVGFGIGIGCVQPVAQGLAMKNTPAEKRGAAGSTIMLGADTGIGAGTAIAGFIAGIHGYRLMFLTFSLFPLAGLMLTVYYRRRLKR